MRRAALILAIVLMMAIIVSWEVCFFVDSQNHQNNHYYAEYKERAAGCAAHVLITPLFWIATVIDENDKIIVALSGVAVAVFTCTLWWSTKLLWESSQIHADHAEKAIAVAREANAIHAAALEAEYRPIISVSIEKEEPIEWSEAGLKTRVIVKIRNHGRSPARIHEDIIEIVPAVGFPPHRDPRVEQENLLGKGAVHIIDRESDLGIVFNDSEYEMRHDLAVPLSEFSGAIDKAYGLTIIGCVKYESFTANGPMWQSAIMRTVFAIDEAGKPQKMIVGNDIPVERIYLLRLGRNNYDRTMPENEIYRQEGGWKPPFKAS